MRDRYLDAYAGYPKPDPYDKWRERRAEMKRRQEVSIRLWLTHLQMVGEGWKLAYAAPLTEAPRG